MTTLKDRPAILVIDDNAITVLAMVSILRADGFHAVGTGSAEQAREYLQTARPDLILMDVQMPGMNGYDYTRELKATPATATIPVVMVTARTLPMDRQMAMEAGCDGFVAKPMSPSDIGTILRRVLGNVKPLPDTPLAEVTSP